MLTGSFLHENSYHSNYYSFSSVNLYFTWDNIMSGISFLNEVSYYYGSSRLQANLFNFEITNYVDEEFTVSYTANSSNDYTNYGWESDEESEVYVLNYLLNRSAAYANSMLDSLDVEIH